MFAKIENARIPSVHCEAAQRLEEQHGIKVSFREKGTENVRRLGESFGRMPNPSVIAMRIEVRKRRELMPVIAFGGKTTEGGEFVQPLEGIETETLKVYTFEINITGSGKKGVAAWPTNRVYVLCEGREGRFRMFLVGAFSQDFQTWTWAELVQAGQLNRLEDGSVTVETPSKTWNALIQEMAGEGRYGRRMLPETDKTGRVGIAQLPLAEIEALPMGQGKVQFWNPFMGFGYAWMNTENGPVAAKVHWIQMQDRRGHGLRGLAAGDIISGKVEYTERQQGPDAGSSAAELKNIRLVKAAES